MQIQGLLICMIVDSIKDYIVTNVNQVLYDFNGVINLFINTAMNDVTKNS